MSRRSQIGRKLSIETLEDRAMCAADLNVALVNGNLTITGDGDSENLQIQQAQASILNGVPLALIKVIGNSGTTLNGQTQLNFIAGTVENIFVDLKGGNDQVLLQNINLPNAPVNALIRTGFGQDQITVQNAQIGGNLFIFSEGNDDNVFVKDSTIGGQLVIDTEDGDDIVAIADTVANSLNIKTGNNEDVVTLQRTQALNQIFVDLGDGDDILLLDTIRAGSLSFLAGDNDDDTLIIKRRISRELLLLAAADDFEAIQFI